MKDQPRKNPSVLTGPNPRPQVQNADLAAGAVGTENIQRDAVTAEVVGALRLEVGKYIHSSNYESGSSGWAIDANGTAEFHDVLVRGDVLASSISASATISASQITSGSISANMISGGTLSGITVIGGGGDVVLDYSGIKIDGGSGSQNKIRWMNGMSELSAIYAYVSGSSSFMKLDADYLSLSALSVQPSSAKVNGSTILTTGNHSHYTGTITTNSIDWKGSLYGTNGYSSYETAGGDSHRHEVPFHTHTVHI